MNHERTEPVTDEMKKNLLQCFAKQNFIQRKNKDNKVKKPDAPEIPPITKQKVWNEHCDFLSEDQMDRVFTECIEGKSEQAVIAEAIAKRMHMDGITDFAEAVSIFWYPPVLFEPVKKQAEKLVPRMAKREEAKRHINDWQNVKIVRTEDGTGESLLRVNLDGDEGSGRAEGRKDLPQIGSVDVHIPKSLVDISESLDPNPPEEKPTKRRRKNYIPRKTVNYNIKADRADVLRLGAAACDLSITEFMEELVANYASAVVRANLQTAEDKGENVKLILGENIYKLMSQKHGGKDSECYIPTADNQEEKPEPRLLNSTWLPDHADTLKKDYPDTWEDAVTRVEEELSLSCWMSAHAAKKVLLIQEAKQKLMSCHEEKDDWRVPYNEAMSNGRQQVTGGIKEQRKSKSS
jgi:hypothetical protein